MPYSEIACAIQRRAFVHSMPDVEVGFKSSAAAAPSSYMSPPRIQIIITLSMGVRVPGFV